MLCDANGVPLRFLLSGGYTSDITYAQLLLDDAYIPSLRGRPRKRCRWLLAERGMTLKPYVVTVIVIGCGQLFRFAA